MSSPRAATKARRPATNGKPKAAAKVVAAKSKLVPQNELSDHAIRLARENGAKFTPIPEGQAVSPTGVMLTASGLLRAANLAVFELGMWQSWTGR